MFCLWAQAAVFLMDASTHKSFFSEMAMKSSQPKW